uniref:Uncharacterized protein n=1 Tax=Rhizophora mucronata TaxID=61149 RepID=A0A2P2IHA4_RHIMU
MSPINNVVLIPTLDQLFPEALDKLIKFLDILFLRKDYLQQSS